METIRDPLTAQWMKRTPHYVRMDWGQWKVYMEEQRAEICGNRLMLRVDLGIVRAVEAAVDELWVLKLWRRR